MTIETPNGCAICGDNEGHHGVQYHPGVGNHRYKAPSDQQRLARMKAGAPQLAVQQPEGGAA